MNAVAIRKPSVDYLMDAPLQQLVDELHITLKEAPISEPGFTGYAFVDKRGVVIAMPPARTELEHDCIARYLIGTVFHVDGMPPLPDLYEVTEVTENTNGVLSGLDGDSDPDMDEALRRVREGGVV
ncbi:hypothetical protein ABZT02_09515 [Streptomyces sp. NPDC005402]|uniref:hypothetical protein n=1 Tax=Streptomyces sp. NPDC005402 TaxID=3155338 RepID=UPI0033B6B688